MLVVGITGGIGSGKSHVANMFEQFGIPCYYSDQQAKDLMNTHPILKKELILKFGSDVYLNNTLNRPFISEQVFKNKELLEWLNGIVHPLVAEDFEHWKNKQNASYVLKEAAILIESGSYKNCDQIIVVVASKDIRVKRIIARDKLSEKQIYERINNQISDKERLNYANFTIHNNGTENVSDQINIIHQNLINKEQ